ncbi:response regulator [Paenibacillus sp. HN-1]|nr:response regulator [Paenibacillus sp. CGMCC 1.18879]MBY9078346.1 response regulator [Paenibacillus sp. CGMCC 1.18879]MBY9083158.1 response regulator [Paenibacillus sinensis]
MYNLMIVDDEMLVVEGLLFDLDKEKLQLSQVLTAYTTKMAKEVFEQHRVDIMLCDIEMPQESGLQLLSWVREHYPDTVSIIITSHADFHYAKEAIELGSLDYLLKPVPTVELERVIEKAKSRLTRVTQFNHYHKFWSQQQPLVVERFWLDLLHHTIPAKELAVNEAMKESKLPFSAEMRFLPLLISVQRWSKDLDLRSRKILEYALKNSAEEMLIGELKMGSIVPLDRSRMLIIFVHESDENAITEQLLTKCKAYIESCTRYFYCDISCYIGASAYAHEISDMYNELVSLERNNVAFNNKVFFLKADAISTVAARLPDMELWATLLKKGAKDTIINEVSSYLDRLVLLKQINAEVLHKLHLDFLQLVYFVLNLKGIQAHQLFSDRLSTELSDNATRSVADLKVWVRHTVDKAIEHSEADNVVDKVKKYIALHLESDELSRDIIAAQTYLNPDYLSRIFKKQTGLSISDYVIHERIRMASELLTKTDMPISQVAGSVGYSNFSHFTNIFKKYMKCSPVEYRLKHQEVGKSQETSRQNVSPLE